MTRRFKSLLQVLPFAIFILGVWLYFLCDYGKNIMHPEVSQIYLPHALKGGATPSWKDIAGTLNYSDFDGDSRIRFVSFYFLILNIKFRLWLFQYFPPHPSLSLTWVFSLLGSPLILFLLIRRISTVTWAPSLGVLLYSCSMGLLSGVTFLFMPAKPLANFHLLLGLYLGALLQARFSKPGFLGLLAFFFLGYFIDETCWFTPLAVLLLFPRILGESPHLKWRVAAVASTFILFLLGVTYVVPEVVKLAGNDQFDFWHFVFHGLKGTEGPLNFSFSNMLYTCSHFLTSLLSPLPESPFGYLLGILFLAGLVGGYRSMDLESRLFTHRLLLATAAFLLFLSLLLTRHIGRMPFPYYYGAQFSVLISLVLALALAHLNQKRFYSGLALLGGLTAVSLINFNYANEYVLGLHKQTLSLVKPELTVRLLRDLRLPEENPLYSLLREKPMVGEEKLSFLQVKEAWLNRHDPTFVLRQREKLPPESTWLPMELNWVK